MTRARKPRATSIVPYESPFAGVEDREAIGIGERGGNHVHLSAFLALRMWADWDTGNVSAGTAKLAELALMPPSTFKRSLAWLEAQGIVVKGRLLRRSGLPRGYGHVREWSVRRYDRWPDSRSTVGHLSTSIAGPSAALAGPNGPVSWPTVDHHLNVPKQIQNVPASQGREDAASTPPRCDYRGCDLWGLKDDAGRVRCFGHSRTPLTA